MMLPKALKKKKSLPRAVGVGEELPLIDDSSVQELWSLVTRSVYELTGGQRHGDSPAHPEL